MTNDRQGLAGLRASSSECFYVCHKMTMANKLRKDCVVYRLVVRGNKALSHPWDFDGTLIGSA